MKATIKDVARLAKVSPSTVSRALHDNPRISEAVRLRVKQVADELNFHPNPMARSLVSRKTRIVGVLFPGSAASSMGHPFYPAVLSGLGSVAGKQRYHMLLSTGSEDLSDTEAVREMADSGYISGLILLAAQNTPLEEQLPTGALPVVEIGHSATGRYCVDTDNIKAGAFAAEYLLTRGHRRILFLGHNARFVVTADRLEGFDRALAAQGITPNPRWVVSSPFLENTTDNELLKSIFCSDGRPTAVVSMDDSLSIGLMGFLHTLGFSVPQDVSIISFNNTQAGQFASPALTTIDVDPFGLGVSAMELLLSILQGQAPQPAAPVGVPFQLIERDSVAAPPGC